MNDDKPTATYRESFQFWCCFHVSLYFFFAFAHQGSITIGRTQKGRTQNGRTQKGRKPLSP